MKPEYNFTLHGIDLTPAEFERLTAPLDAAKTPQERFTRALERAAVAGYAFAESNDGGTCNFDAPALAVDRAALKQMHMDRKTVEAAISGAGLTCWEWKSFCSRRLVLNGAFYGQASRRSRMATAFAKSLDEAGYPVSMYYQMD